MVRQEAELGRHLPLGLAKIRPDTMWADKPQAEATRTMDSSTGFLVWDPSVDFYPQTHLTSHSFLVCKPLFSLVSGKPLQQFSSSVSKVL